MLEPPVCWSALMTMRAASRRGCPTGLCHGTAVEPRPRGWGYEMLSAGDTRSCLVGQRAPGKLQRAHCPPTLLATSAAHRPDDSPVLSMLTAAPGPALLWHLPSHRCAHPQQGRPSPSSLHLPSPRGVFQVEARVLLHPHVHHEVLAACQDLAPPPPRLLRPCRGSRGLCREGAHRGARARALSVIHSDYNGSCW